MAALRLFLVTIFFPLVTIVMLWRRPPRPRVAWVATLILAVGVAGFSFLAAPWGWFGLPMRYTMLVLFLLALLFSLRRPVPEDLKDEPPMRTMVKVLIGLFFGGVAVGALRGREVPPKPIELAFPLRGGAYLVEHGGSTGPSNIHNAQPAQRFAVDLVKLNGIGMRARGIYPSDVTRYAIYGAEVFSPCSGVVVSAIDGLPDAVDEKRPFGNHVVVRCHGVDVTLAQLQKGSVAVKRRTQVTVHQLLGRAGNSGLSAEPHLHVHAERNGAAVPARFDGKWLVRNDVIR